MKEFAGAYIKRIITNAASVKVWIFFASLWALKAGLIGAGEFEKIIIALIAAREIWKVSSLKINQQNGKEKNHD